MANNGRGDQFSPFGGNPSVVVHYTADDRADLLTHPTGFIAHKTARVVAIKLGHAFTVDTAHGQMVASPGDYLVTNHPDDDPSSDVWPVEAERFERTYQRHDVDAVMSRVRPAPDLDPSPDESTDA